MAPNDFKNETIETVKNDDKVTKANEGIQEDEPITKYIGTDLSYKHTLVWKNVIGFFIIHSLAVWGLYLAFTGAVNFKTVLWAFFLIHISNLGVTVGAHRLYTHRSYKAKPALKALLIILQTMAGENTLFTWSRDHRLHHRYADTDGDPHNSKRGFFFCHVGWAMCKKNPYVIELGRRIDMSDLAADWMVMFQKKYYYYLYFLFAILIPTFVPCYFWNESLKSAILFGYFTRYMLILNGTWLVNSAAHMYGTRPYDKKMAPVESWFVSLLTLGEGWHNYHHTFPWDYKAAELGTHFNYSAKVIRFCEKIGLAYDLKYASHQMVTRRILKTGDGTHYALGNEKDKLAVTAVGPVHPLNPSYTVKYEATDITVTSEGLPLFHENDVLNTKFISRSATA